MDLDELLGIDLRNPTDRLARLLADEDEDLVIKLVAIRRRRDMSQTEVAQLMGVSQSAVARIESGDRDLHLSTVRRYALAVGAVVEHVVEQYDHDQWMRSRAGEHLPRLPEAVVANQPSYLRKVLAGR